jgi:hypothetical protein
MAIFWALLLSQGYQENRPSQQLFKAFIVFILRPLLSFEGKRFLQ